MSKLNRHACDSPFERRSRQTVWCVLAAGLLLAAAATWYMKAAADRLAEQAFVAGCGEVRRIIADRLDDHARILLGGAALFNASESVTREEWRSYTQYQKVEKLLPGIQGFGFALLIPRAELSRHIAQLRAEGFPDYTVKPAGDRETYTSIIYLEPFADRNLRAFGYDMLSEPVRCEAMQRACDTDGAALSGKVVLVQEGEKAVQAGTLMYVPVFRKGLPAESVEQRRAALVGWVYSPYRMTDLLQGILGGRDLEQERRLHLAVFDGAQPSPASRLYDSQPAACACFQKGARFTRLTPVAFNGRCWSLLCTQPGVGLFTAEYAEAWLTLTGGTLIVLLLCALLRALLNTRVNAQRLAEALTVDLQKSEESLSQATQRLSLAVRAGGVGIWDYDVLNNWLVWDDQMFRLYGITREQFGGAYEAWQAGLHPDDRLRGDEEIRLALQGVREFDTEFRVLWPDGTTHAIRALASVQRDASGRPVRMTGTNWDITAQKQAEMEMVQLSVIQRELMHLATDFVNVPLERQDTAIDQSLATMGQLICADRAYLFAYDFGAGVMNNTHEWCGAGIAPEIANLQAVPTELLPEWVEPHRRGEWIHIPSIAALPAQSRLRQILEAQGIRSLITLPMMNDSACLGFVGFDAVREERVWKQEEVSLLRVLAELYAHFEARRAAERATRELQARLTAARDAAQAAALAKSLFLANMSHEIRTPLNAILGYAQIMTRECRACPTGQRLNAITRSGEHLLELLTDLLELVRSDAGKVPLASEPFDFFQALEDVRLMFARHPAAQALTLEVFRTPEVPQFLFADPGKVRQVLVNLVGNALKFTEKGGVRLRASFEPGLTPEAGRAAVEVEDTGRGLAEGELERVFEIFEVAESGRKSGGGTGLGLPLSRRYARALGGDLTVTSRVGEGSCFRFTFRAAAVSAGAAAPLSLGSVRRLAPEQPVCRILVVDDDPANCDMLAALLEPVGFAVEIAGRAAQALERLGKDGKIDLVLMDKCMPEMDGYEAISRIRQLPGCRALPVLVVTASGFVDEKAPALAAGADGYIAKPVRREQLLAEIGRVAGLRYEYEPAAPAAPALPAPVALEPVALARLPAELRDGLEQALRRGDIRQLRALVETAAASEPGLAAGLRVLSDAYDYDRLHRLLKAAKGKNDES